MANDREALAGLLADHIGYPEEWDAADAVIAAGWRPPARVVADGGEVEAIAVEWMRHVGFTAEEIAEAEAHSCTNTCERAGDAWDCTDEDGESRHPIADELAAATDMANVALETLESRGWRPPVHELAITAEDLKDVPPPGTTPCTCAPGTCNDPWAAGCRPAELNHTESDEATEETERV